MWAVEITQLVEVLDNVLNHVSTFTVSIYLQTVDLEISLISMLPYVRVVEGREYILNPIMKA